MCFFGFIMASLSRPNACKNIVRINIAYRYYVEPTLMFLTNKKTIDPSMSLMSLSPRAF
ncbi:hypothetical protein KCTC52924_00145 [Arenibacter antarcticus]